MAKTFKFIRGVTSNDKIITDDNDALIAAYSDGDRIADPSALMNTTEFQNKIAGLSATDRKATIYTSTINMLTPNCTVVVDSKTQDHSLTINSFNVGNSRSLGANLPEKVEETFQNVSSYSNASCTIQGAISWNRGSENSRVTPVKLTVKNKEKTFSNCKFTITGKVDKTYYDEASGAGSGLTLYDSTLSLVNTSNKANADYYKDGKRYLNCEEASTITRSSITLDDEASFEKITESASTIILMEGYLMTSSSVTSITGTESDSVRTSFELPSAKGGTASYSLWKKTETKSGHDNEIAVDSEGKIKADNSELANYTKEAGGILKAYKKDGELVKFVLAGDYYQNEGQKGQTVYSGTSTSTNYIKVKDVTITYSKDVYLGEKTYTKVWDSSSGSYDAGITTGVPMSGPLYLQSGSIEGDIFRRQDTSDTNFYYVQGKTETLDIDDANTSLSGNIISGKTSAPNWITDVKDNTVVKSVIIQ